jgi:hypothetical protein
MDLALLVAEGKFTPEVCAWLAAGFAARRRARGRVSLDRCLHMPCTEAKFLQEERDGALRQVALLLQVPGNLQATARAVSTEFLAFLSRGPWRSWHNLEEPPPGTSDLRRALFAAAKASRGRHLGHRQIERQIADMFPR